MTFRVSKNVVYTVVFKDNDGRVLKEAKVQNHDTAVPLPNPQRENYIFIEWNDKGYTDVTKDLELTAIYEKVAPGLELVTENSHALSKQ